MCDYSLERVASRAAVTADRLVTASFAGTITQGFAGLGDPNVAVCLRPGTELAFDAPPKSSTSRTGYLGLRLRPER
jgi:hypothetical protein